MIVKTYINGGKIIDSGVTIIEDDSKLKFEFPEAGVAFFIEFAEDTNLQGMRWEPQMTDEGQTLRLINSKSSNYGGVDDFIEAAEFNDKKLCLKFKVIPQGNEFLFFYKWILK